MTQESWTNDDKLKALLRLPWTLQFGTDEQDGTFTVQVAELPDAIAVGENDRQLSKMLYEAIEASLASRLEHGDPIPLPPQTTAPWDTSERPQYRRWEIHHDMAFPREVAAKLETTDSTSNVVDLTRAGV